jgi:nickel-dependent lactate racemase
VTTPWVRHGTERVPLRLPPGLAVRVVEPRAVAAPDPLGAVAQALDEPVGAPPLAEAARGKERVAVIVPDPTRPSAASAYLLPVIARLARAGLTPSRIKIVVARGIHPTAGRGEVEQTVGTEVMEALRPVQSAPETPELNVSIGADPELGDVRIHRIVADSPLVVLTGAVTPHHLAGFGGGPKALVPGVAERGTVLAAHRLTLRTLVAPDGSLTPVEGRLGENPFYDALLRVARGFGRCWLLNVVLGDGGAIASAAAGEVGAAHERAAALWSEARGLPPPEPSDLVVAGVGAPRDGDLIQAHKGLVAALAWAKPGAPIVWMARAPNGPGHPEFLPWFEAGRLDRHLAALRREFHPYGLTAYSIRRIAKDHPVHVVSSMSPDLLRPMGLLPFATADAALAHALANADVKTCVVLPDAGT